MKRMIIALVLVAGCLFFLTSCGSKKAKTEAISNEMPTSNKDFADLGFNIYTCGENRIGVELYPGQFVEFSTLIMNDDMSRIGFTEDYSFMFCIDPESDDWSMISAYNPDYEQNEYMTFQDGSQIPAMAMKNAYVMAQIMRNSTVNSMKYVLPKRLADAISDDDIDVTLALIGNTETGEFPKDISEGMWQISLRGRNTGNCLTLIPGRANPKVNAYTIDYTFSYSTIDDNPELRELYTNVYTVMENEGSSFDSGQMKANFGEDTIDAVIAVLPYINYRPIV